MICLLVQILGIIAGAIGMILTWVVTFLPQWRLFVLTENNSLVVDGGRVDGEWISRWDGLWVTCVTQMRAYSQGASDCRGYESMVSLTNDLKAGRVFMGFAIAVTLLAFIFSLVAVLLSRCCCVDYRDQCCLSLTAGIFYILSAVLVLVPVVWTTRNIVQGTYDASLTGGAVRIQVGESLILAYPTVAFLLLGGLILCFVCCCYRRENGCQYKLPLDQQKACRDQCSDERSSCTPRMQYI
ncbi:claudin-8-like [Gastrophryne carolinensis]